MVNPLYIAENAPRAIRGGLTGIYQLFIVLGIFLAYWINYGCLQHLSGTARYMVPLVIQGLPPVLLMISMWLCNESPRFLAKQDKWEESLAILSRIRARPSDHPYVANEFSEIRQAIEAENAILDGASWKSLQKELWLIPANRNRAIISILLMFFQQMTGTSRAALISLKTGRLTLFPRYQRHQLLRAPDLLGPRHQRRGERALRDRHLRSRQAGRRVRLPGLRRRLPRPSPLPSVDGYRSGADDALHRHLRPRGPAWAG